MGNRRLIQVYTGDGKGKTTAAIGLAVRAAGRGLKTFFAQFMKCGEYGEHLAIHRWMKDSIVFEQFGVARFHFSDEPVSEEERESAAHGLRAVKDALIRGLFDIIVLDEINVALHFGIVPPEPVLEIMDIKPLPSELILTGRRAPAEVLQRAHLITEMWERRHYYNDGISARPGIEI